MAFFASREDDNDLSDDEANRLSFQVAPNRDNELRAMQQTIIEAHEGMTSLFLLPSTSAKFVGLWVVFSVESAGDDSDHEWERQQIRKGVGMAQMVKKFR